MLENEVVDILLNKINKIYNFLNIIYFINNILIIFKKYINKILNIYFMFL